MPQGKRAHNAPAASGGDGIDALPDGVLEHIIGFLRSPEAVRTSVLARRWRHLWKSATGLYIMCISYYGEEVATVKKRQDFVDHLLRGRGLAPLETCKIKFGCLHGGDDTPGLNHWIRHVVECKVQMLMLHNIYHDFILLDDLPLASVHLTRLELIGIDLSNGFCNLSSCPALEYLELEHCDFWCTKKISSESLKCLRITRCRFSKEFRTLIYVPRLVSLRLVDHWCRTPVFETVPTLQEASVTVTDECENCCNEADSDYCHVSECFTCDYPVQDNSKCLNQEGLSGAEDLNWIVESKMFILRNDLKQWPNFSILKTLSLDGYWCVAPDFDALNYILKHSPVLEKLTLQLFLKVPDHTVEIIGRCCPIDRSPAISKHLKSIEVKCKALNGEVDKMLSFLSTFNIYFFFK